MHTQAGKRLRQLGFAQRTRPANQRYGAALAAILLSVLISVWLRPFSNSTPFLFFYPAVIFSAWIGGLGPGLLATLICSLAANYFLLGRTEQFDLDFPNTARTVFFASGFGGICWLAELARKQFHSIIRVQSELLALTLDPIIVRDEDGCIVYWNHGAERLYGWSEDEACGQVEDVLLRTRFPKPIEEILAEFGTSHRWQGELTHTKKDGSTVIVASSWTLQTRRKRGVVLEVNYDLTDRKHAEHALRESEETLRVVFNSAYDGIVIHTSDGAILDVNDRFLAMYQITRNEIGDLSIPDISSPESPIDTLPSLWASVIAGESQLFEWKALRPHSGSEFDVEVFLRRIQLGGRDAVLANVRDITDRKRSEHEKRMLQMQLAQAQKLEAIGRMAGGVAHDFNNLLSVISGYSELGLRSDPEQATQSLGQIQRATGTAAALTRQLLTFSRNSAVEPLTIDVCEVIRETVPLLPRLLGEDIEVRIHADAESCAARMTPGQLEQIVINLAVNARDAMPKGGTLSFMTSSTYVDEARSSALGGLSTGTYVMLSVSDTGEGVSDELADRIFEPFFTTKEPGKGTGLGLSTVRGIVNQNGGRVFVDSMLGQGTTFTIYLPQENALPSEPSDRAVPTDLPRGSETILLVEDSAALCEMTKAFLEMQGYTVHSAGNGVEALALLEKVDADVDLLLTDVVMPIMSGPELAQKIRSFRPQLRILFTSGYARELLEKYAADKSSTHMLEKPYSFEMLSVKVRQVLDEGMKFRRMN